MVTSAWRKQLEGSAVAEHNVLFRITQLIRSVKWRAHVSDAHTHTLYGLRDWIPPEMELSDVFYLKLITRNCVLHSPELTQTSIHTEKHGINTKVFRCSSNTIYNQSERTSVMVWWPSPGCLLHASQYFVSWFIFYSILSLFVPQHCLIEK